LDSKKEFLVNRQTYLDYSFNVTWHQAISYCTTCFLSPPFVVTCFFTIKSSFGVTHTLNVGTRLLDQNSTFQPGPNVPFWVEQKKSRAEVARSIRENQKWTAWWFPKIGVPQHGWFIMENPIKMDDLGVPLFSETSA